jgi:outer membrane protein insertion porin family
MTRVITAFIRRSTTGSWLWLAAMVCLCVPPAYAQVMYEAAAYKGWKVTSIDVRGLDKKMASDLADGLVLSTKPDFYPQLLSDDIDRSMLFLARRGYPYASVSAAFEPDHRRKRLEVALDVDRGPPVVVRQVAVDGIPEGLMRPAGNLVTVKPGGVFTDENAARTTESLLSLLMNSGYARAEVTMNVEATDTGGVILGFDAEPGFVNYFRNVNVENASKDLVPLTGKVTDIRGGQRYSPKRIKDAQENLRRLDLYRRIRVGTEEVGSDSLDVVVDVAARRPQTIKARLSYWNDEGFRLGLSWRHRNLFRGGRGLFAGATASLLLQRFDVSSWWPALIAPRTREAVSVIVEHQNEEAYGQLRRGVELSSSYFFTLDDNIRTAISVSNVDVDRKTTGEMDESVEEGLLTELYVRVNQNNTDDPFNPTTGTSSWSELTWAPNGVVSDNHYLLWEGSGSTYMTVYEYTILALRLGVGLGTPTGASGSILASQRFYSGGANSMRGFRRRALGPKDAAGAPVGGEAKAEASFEIRQPLFWRIWGTLFADVGQVWRKLDDIRLDRMEVAVGPGIWLMTPVGPLRFDVAYRLTLWDESEPRWAYHLSIGPAF